MRWLLPCLLLACAGGGGDGAFCVDAINQYRATLGLAPYARWSEEEACADQQSASDASSMAAHGAFGHCTELAQNECPGWPGSDSHAMLGPCLAQMWSEGPGADFQAHGHYLNMTSTQYTKVACGFHQLPSGDWWAVQDFR